MSDWSGLVRTRVGRAREWLRGTFGEDSPKKRRQKPRPQPRIEPVPDVPGLKRPTISVYAAQIKHGRRKNG